MQSAAGWGAGSLEKYDTLVIGSGVSGSSLGFSLFQKGVNVLVTEARDVVGGNVITREQDGFLWEEGPNTFQPTRQIMRLAVDLGLKDELVFADHTLPRCAYWDKELFPLPSKPEDAPFFRLLSIPEKIRAGIGAIGLHAPKPDYEESVKDFIERHLGEAVFKKMIDPFVSGVYAGDPTKLSMASAFKKIYALEDLGMTPSLIEGGIIRQAERAKEARENYDPELPTYKGGALGSFKKGLVSLPKAAQEKLGDRLRTSWKVESISKGEDGGYVTKFSTPQGSKEVWSKTVAVTAPAHATVGMLSELVPECKALEEIHYPCVYSVTLAYPKECLKDEVRKERPGLGESRREGVCLSAQMMTCSVQARGSSGSETSSPAGLLFFYSCSFLSVILPFPPSQTFYNFLSFLSLALAPKNFPHPALYSPLHRSLPLALTLVLTPAGQHGYPYLGNDLVLLALPLPCSRGLRDDVELHRRSPGPSPLQPSHRRALGGRGLSLSCSFT